jgi:CHAT domain-containing protein
MREALYPKDKHKSGHPVLANSLQNVAVSLLRTGQYEEALKHARRALAMCEALYPKDKHKSGHPDLAISLNILGIMLQRQGETEEALKHLRRALEMRQAIYPKGQFRNGHPDLATSLTNLGLARHVQGSYAEALKHLRLALEMRRHEVDAVASSASEDHALNFSTSLLPLLTRDGMLSAGSHVKDSGSDVYGAVWPTRSAVTRVTEQRHLAMLASASPDLQSRYDKLRRKHAERSGLLLMPVGVPEKEREARARQLETLAGEIEKAEADLCSLLPPLAHSEKLARSTPKDLQKSLPLRTAFIDLLRYYHLEQDRQVKGAKGQKLTPRYVAFVLTPDRLARIDLGDAKPIEEALDLWRRAIGERSDSAAKYARQVRELVWDKVAKEVGDAETVYLTPDGRLTQLPWAALPGDRAGTILLEQRALAVVPHGVFLLDRLTAPKTKPDERPVFLAVGGVRYDDAPKAPDDKTLAALKDLQRAPALDDGKRVKWAYLKGTEAELKSIETLGKGFTVRPVSGAEASTQRLLAELPQARYAHLATHGFFADAKFRSVLQLDEKLFERKLWDDGSTARRVGVGARNPLVLSGLVLAGANCKDSPDRGILSADDLVRLDLRKLELAVLSACETGLGDVGGGEGVFGLQRAFHVAGCHNVIASLWKVDDEATAALMGLFYRYLVEQKLAPIEALRRAQLAVYHNPSQIKKWSQNVRGPNLEKIFPGNGRPDAEEKADDKTHPKSWAAFTLSGLAGDPDGSGSNLASDPGAAPTDDVPADTPAATEGSGKGPLMAALAAGAIALGVVGVLAYRRSRARRGMPE